MVASSEIDFSDLTLSLFLAMQSKGTIHLRRVPSGAWGKQQWSGREKGDWNQLDTRLVPKCLTGEEELGNDGSWGGLNNVVWLEQTMGDGLLNTHSCSLLIVQCSEGEWESSGLLLDLGEDGSRSLHLELVVDISLFVDGSP